METSNSIPNIGSLIRTELVRQNHTVTWLAQSLNIKRPNCYRLLRASSIHTDTLYRVSIALRHDFFAECSAALKSQLNNSQKY